MPNKIRVAILEDHQSIIDGYTYRLSMAPEITVVGTAGYGESLEPMLKKHPADVLLLDVFVPTSSENHNPFPIMNAIPRLLELYPELDILVISMLAQRSLIDALIKAGVSGYIFKDDQASIQDLAKIVSMIANGGFYTSHGAYRGLQSGPADTNLTPRQLEALSLCASYPDSDTAELAKKLGIAHSTFRNLLSGTYLRLKVRTRAAAIAKAQRLGLFPNEPKPG